MVTSIKSNGLFLGRTPDASKMVSRITSESGSGSDFRLLYKEFTRSPDGKAILKRTLEAVDEFDCGRCVNYLSYIFEKGNINVKVGPIKTTPVEFMQQLTHVCALPSTSVGPVTFVGGPPGRAKVHTGTFGTILKDCILRAVYTNNTKKLITLNNLCLIHA